MKRIFALLLLSSFVYIVKAQPHADIGIKAGVNINNLKIENSSAPDSRVGFHFGGLVHLHVSNNFAIQPEVVFSSQGMKQTIAGTENIYKLSYVNFPVLLQYMTGSGFRVATGPQLGVMVSAERHQGNTETTIKEDFKTIDFSWPLGVSYVTDGGFGVDLRYNMGLSNINDNSNGAKIKNRVWQFGVFYQFRVTPMGQKHL